MKKLLLNQLTHTSRDRFHHYLLFEHDDLETAISPCKVCEEYVWSQEEGGRGLGLC